MAFLLTIRGGGGGSKATAPDYLTMEELGEWKLDTCEEAGDHLLQSQAMETRWGLQHSPKMLMVYQ